MDKLEVLVKNANPLYYIGGISGGRPIKKMIKSLRDDMKYCLEYNEENEVVTIPKFILEKWIKELEIKIKELEI